MSMKCADCKNFVAYDVFTGYCEKKREAAQFDDVQENCAGYVEKGKCKNCKNYGAVDAACGTCMGNEFAYAELPACENYQHA